MINDSRTLLKHSGLYLDRVRGTAIKTLQLLDQKPRTLNELKGLISGSGGLSPLMLHKLAEHIPGPSPVKYQPTQAGKDYLEKLREAQILPASP